MSDTDSEGEGEGNPLVCIAKYLRLLEEARQLCAEAKDGNTDSDRVTALSCQGLRLLRKHKKNMEIATLDISLMEILFNTYHLMYGTLFPEKFEFDPKEFARRIMLYCETTTSPSGIVYDEGDSLLLKKKMAPLCFEHMRFQPPNFSSIMGTMKVTEKEKKPKEVREKRTKDIIEEVKRPEQVSKVKGRTLEETVTEVGKQLNKAFKDNDEEPINFIEFVVDPKSFHQTVENIFHVSFLVNNADATIFVVDDQDSPLIEPNRHYYEAGASLSKTRDDKNALVMTITKEEWQEAINMFDITTAMIKMKPDTETAGPGSSRRR